MKKTIGIIFSRGTSLKALDAAGILKREYGYFVELSKYFSTTYLFVYGSDHDLRDYLNSSFPSNIKIISLGSEKKFFSLLASIFFPLLNFRNFRNVNYWRTQQADGAWTGLIFSKLTGGRFIFRQGYSWTEFLKFRKKWIKYFIASIIEWVLCIFADKIFITSEKNLRELSKKIPRSKNKMYCVPNFAFEIKARSKVQNEKNQNNFVFTGRLTTEKNISYLLKLFETCPGKLFLVGSGELENKIKNSKAENIHYIGKIDNQMLVSFYNKMNFFISLSKIEGHPKAIIEAMSVGLIPITRKSSGIEDLIDDGVNGFFLNCCDLIEDRQKIADILYKPDLNVISKRAKTSVNSLTKKNIVNLEVRYINAIS